MATSKNESSYASVVGSTISAICFFSPWVGCAGKDISGADLGGALWLVFLSSVISLISFLFFNSQKELSKARVYILISSIVGLGIMVIEYLRFQSAEFHSAFEIKWGGLGTAVGFVISLIGVQYLNDENVGLHSNINPDARNENETLQKTINTPVTIIDENTEYECSSCNSTVLEDDKFCKNCGAKL